MQSPFPSGICTRSFVFLSLSTIPFIRQTVPVWVIHFWNLTLNYRFRNLLTSKITNSIHCILVHNINICDECQYFTRVHLLLLRHLVFFVTDLEVFFSSYFISSNSSSEFGSNEYFSLIPSFVSSFLASLSINFAAASVSCSLLHPVYWRGLPRFV
jgi:hypothetical protein